MFEDLNWRWAVRRAAAVIGIYIALFYALSVAFPESFPLQINLMLVQVPIFFVMFTFVYAFVDRSRRRRLAEMSRKAKGGRTAGNSEAGPGELKGRPNPNTSRKKARRRR